MALLAVTQGPMLSRNHSVGVRPSSGAAAWHRSAMAVHSDVFDHYLVISRFKHSEAQFSHLWRSGMAAPEDGRTPLLHDYGLAVTIPSECARPRAQQRGTGLRWRLHGAFLVDILWFFGFSIEKHQ